MRKIFQTKKVRPYLTNFDYVNVLKHSTQRKFHQPGFADDRELNLEANDLVESGQNSDEWKDAMDICLRTDVQLKIAGFRGLRHNGADDIYT